MDLAGIKKKVAALLAQTTERGCTVEEAANAARIAQTLITKYRLEMADLADADTPLEFNEQVLYVSNKNMDRWRGALAQAVAGPNDCVVFKRGNRLIAVGTEANRELCAWLFVKISVQVEWFSNLYASGQGRTYANTYRHGMIHTIHDRLQQAQRQAEAATNTERAMVRVNTEREALARHIKDSYKLKTRNGKRRRFNASAYAHGRKDGERVSVNKELE